MLHSGAAPAGELGGREVGSTVGQAGQQEPGSPKWWLPADKVSISKGLLYPTTALSFLSLAQMLLRGNEA